MCADSGVLYSTDIQSRQEFALEATVTLYKTYIRIHGRISRTRNLFESHFRASMYLPADAPAVSTYNKARALSHMYSKLMGKHDRHTHGYVSHGAIYSKGMAGLRCSEDVTFLP